MLWRRGRRRGVLLFLFFLILGEAVLALVAACVDGVLRRGTMAWRCSQHGRVLAEKTKDAGRGRAAARTIHARPAAMTSENATLKPRADGGRSRAKPRCTTPAARNPRRALITKRGRPLLQHRRRRPPAPVRNVRITESQQRQAAREDRERDDEIDAHNHGAAPRIIKRAPGRRTT